MRKLLVLLFVGIMGFAQNSNGYWDNVRTTNETISLKAGEKKNTLNQPISQKEPPKLFLELYC